MAQTMAAKQITAPNLSVGLLSPLPASECRLYIWPKHCAPRGRHSWRIRRQASHALHLFEVDALRTASTVVLTCATVSSARPLSCSHGQRVGKEIGLFFKLPAIPSLIVGAKRSQRDARRLFCTARRDKHKQHNYAETAHMSPHPTSTGHLNRRRQPAYGRKVMPLTSFCGSCVLSRSSKTVRWGP